MSPITKADVFGKVIDSGDVPLQLACLELVNHPLFADNLPGALRGLVEGIQYPTPADGLPLSNDLALAYASMSGSEVIAFQVALGDTSKKERLLDQMREHLVRWGISI